MLFWTLPMLEALRSERVDLALPGIRGHVGGDQKPCCVHFPPNCPLCHWSMPDSCHFPMTLGQSLTCFDSASCFWLFFWSSLCPSASFTPSATWFSVWHFLLTDLLHCASDWWFPSAQKGLFPSPRPRALLRTPVLMSFHWCAKPADPQLTKTLIIPVPLQTR